MLYIVSILPLFVYILLMKSTDSFKLSNWKLLLTFMSWGSMACLSLFALTRISGWQSDTVIPVLEELLKAILVFFFILRKRIAFIVEAVIYGAAVGAGFALVENGIYIFFNPDMLMGNAIIRGFGTALLHIGGTALAGSLFIMVSRFFIFDAGHRRENAGLLLLPTLVAALLPSVLVHEGYNQFLLPPYLQIVIVIVVYLVFFMATSALDEKQINNWLDSCINNDVTLLSQIQSGQLSDTKAGQYLMMMQKQFEPEVFFDLIMYLQLYLELTIAAKSRMLMLEAGLDPDEIREGEDDTMSKFKELRVLEHNIGITGMNILRPIVNQKNTDIWAMEKMLG